MEKSFYELWKRVLETKYEVELDKEFEEELPATLLLENAVNKSELVSNKKKELKLMCIMLDLSSLKGVMNLMEETTSDIKDSLEYLGWGINDAEEM